LSTGQALAIIVQDTQNIHTDHVKINDEDKEYFQQIKDRYVELTNNPVESAKIINTVPLKGCPAGKPFLENNTDFFIAYIILSENNNKNLNTTPQLIRHLNDCYWCFKDYNNFIKDYYYTSQRYKGEGNYG